MAEGAKVEPVVAHPTIDHGTLRSRDFESWVRIHERHDYGEAFIRASEHTDLAVGFRHVFHKPFDGVVSVCGFVGQGRVQRATKRTRHEVLALRAVFAADVLENANVAIGDKDFVALGQCGKHVGRIRSGGAPSGIIRRARKENGSVVRALRHDNDGKELDAIAHGNHDVALFIVI